MTRNQILNGLHDFERWQDDERRKMKRKNGDPNVIRIFSERCDEVKAKLQQFFAQKNQNIQVTTVQKLQQSAHLLGPVQMNSTLKIYSGIGVRRRDDASNHPDIISMLNEKPNVEWDPARTYESFASFTFGEADGDRHLIETIPCSNARLLRNFQNSGNNVQFQVTGVLLLNEEEQRYTLLLLDLQKLSDPLSFLSPTRNEMVEAEQRVSSFGGRSMLKSLTDEIVRELEIIDQGDLLFREAMEVAVLQGASHGMIRGESARIHSFIIGPPAYGKGEICKACAACQPTYVRLEAQAITEDGLYGNSGNSSGKRIVNTGKVAQANQGALIVEDFHMANSLKGNRLRISFSYTMERGRVEAANASRMSYEAQVAFHADANRRSDVGVSRSRNLDGLKQVCFDTGMQKNLLTRFDYISEFMRNPKRQLELSLQIARTPVGQRNVAQGEPGRRVALMLASLRTVIPSVEIGVDVAEYLERRFKAIINADARVLDAFPDYADFMTRGGKSYRKFVMAHARLCNRSRATTDDVDAVFPYVLRKFETVLSWLVGGQNTEATQVARKAARHLLIRIKFGGQSLELKQIISVFPGVSTKTVTRDMNEVCGLRSSEGVWLVPSIVEASEPNRAQLLACIGNGDELGRA